MLYRVLPLSLLALVGCVDDKGETDDSSTETQDEYVDNDGDDYFSDEDCDDSDPQVNPGETEICDSVDNNCDGEVDEGVEQTWYVDDDGDGYGDGDNVVLSCQRQEGTVPNASDCDDTSPLVYPGANEICDELDNDCDGETDEDAITTWYVDADGDGFGDPDTEILGCDAPEDAVTDDTDCDDEDATAYPGGTEICDGVDNDCDGDIDDDLAEDRTEWYLDADDDGFGDPETMELACAQPRGYVSNDNDCDDLEELSHPGADEICDEEDNDCNGTADEDAVDAPAWYADDDLDGFGDASEPSYACDAPTGTVADATDCDDADASENPDASEVCDGDDDDCDDEIDEDSAADAPAWYADRDEDGYGDADATTRSCSQPDGYLSNRSDCDDADPTEHPGADEVCDGDDDDCDDDVDEDSAVDAPTWYQDRDGDSFGDAALTTESCSAPSGYVSDDQDCDDLADESYPGADEICDDEDNDCDGATDEDGAVGAPTWYRDGDSDGFGDPSSTKDACDAPSGYVVDATDCDDSDGDENPDASEVCDGDDDDCDDEIDEDSAIDADTWYRDSDGDGAGDAATTDVACSAPDGFVASGADCDDTDVTEYPGASERCDGDDDDCDGSVDEASAIDAVAWYQDRDDDGYGDEDSTRVACDMPDGYVDDATDCDDFADESHPGADEICDDEDNDCDETVDESAVDASTWYRDADGDLYGDIDTPYSSCDAPSGFVSNSSDCDDTSSSNRPGATEVCDGEDNDCDDLADESGASGESRWYPDADSDGYGSSSASATTACDAPTGYVSSADDCDDADDEVNPDGTEYCDGVDQDCDGDEDGVVHYQTITGSKTSLTSTWGSGTSSSPKSISQSSSGTIYVCPGTYYVAVTSSATALEIEGLYGSDETFLSGGGSKRVVSASGDITLTGLTIQDGYTSSSYGGNVYVNGADATLSDVILQDGFAKWGAGAACRSGTLSMTEVEITGGDASYGGGVYMSSCTGDATTALIYDNSATYGAGVYITASDLTLDDTDMSANDADSYGGAIAALSSSTVTITDTEITSNSGGDYGGGAYMSASDWTMSTSNVSGNSSTLVGGGLYLYGASTLKCTGSSGATYGIWGNTSLLAGGVYMAATSGASIRSTTCDWLGSSDNDLYDIVIGGYLYYSKYDNNETFTCSYTGC